MHSTVARFSQLSHVALKSQLSHMALISQLSQVALISQLGHMTLISQLSQVALTFQLSHTNSDIPIEPLLCVPTKLRSSNRLGEPSTPKEPAPAN